MGFGSRLHVPLRSLQDRQSPDMMNQSQLSQQPFIPLILTRLTIEATMPAIRHMRSHPWLPYCICAKGCKAKDKASCDHKMDMEIPVYYINTIGHLITKRVAMHIGPSIPFRTTWYQQETMDDLTVPRMHHTDEETGRHYVEGDLIDWSMSKPEITVTSTLLFPPMQQMSQGLPLVLFNRAPIHLDIQLPSLKECTYSLDHSKPHLLFAKRKLQDSDLKIRVYAELMELHDPELQKPSIIERPITFYWPYFENHRGLIRVNRSSEGKATISIPVRNEILEVLWMLCPQRQVNDSRGYIPLDPTQNPFNWRGENGEDVASHMELNLGGRTVVTMRDAKWFRSNNQRVHLNKPKNHIYGYSWSPCPDRADLNTSAFLINPSSANEHVTCLEIVLKFQPYIKHCNWFVMIRRPNAGQVQYGMLQLRENVPPEMDHRARME